MTELVCPSMVCNSQCGENNTEVMPGGDVPCQVGPSQVTMDR